MSTTTDAPILHRLVARSDDREAWLAARRQGVTATDLAKFGRGSASALRRILADKRGELAEIRTAAMLYGTEREPAIAEWVESQSRAGRFGSGPLVPGQGLYARIDRPEDLATPDGISVDFEFFRELVEIKTTSKPWTSIPLAYRRQVWWQQHVMGADRTLVVWEERDEFYRPVHIEPRYEWVKRDQAQIDELVEHARTITRFMADELPPPPEDLDETITRYLDLARRRDYFQGQLDAIEADLLERAHGRSLTVLGTAGDLSVSPPSEQFRFSQSAFREVHPELYERFKRPVSYKASVSITALKPATDEEG